MGSVVAKAQSGPQPPGLTARQSRRGGLWRYGVGVLPGRAQVFVQVLFFVALYAVLVLRNAFDVRARGWFGYALLAVIVAVYVAAEAAVYWAGRALGESIDERG